MSTSNIKQQENTTLTTDNDERKLLLKFEFDGKQYELANLTMGDHVSDLRAVLCAMLNIDNFDRLQLKTLRPTRIIDYTENGLRLSEIFSQTRERIVVERRLLTEDYGIAFGLSDSNLDAMDSYSKSSKPPLKQHKPETEPTRSSEISQGSVPKPESSQQSSPLQQQHAPLQQQKSNPLQQQSTASLHQRPTPLQQKPAPLQQQANPLQQQLNQSQSSTNSDESPLRQRKMPREQQATQIDQMPVCSSTGYFLRQPVPANNSCLFISVHYCLTNGTIDDQIGKSMRKIIAETVASDKEKFDDAFLGKSNSEYCSWILDDNNWGGAIELSILCKYYETEIVAIDVKNLILNRFGEDSQFQQRMLLLYDGLHYDPLKFQPFDENRQIITMFPIENTEALTLGLQVARELKQTHQFTDLNTITMICSTCDAHLDAKTASEHAAKTGHNNFRETV